MTPVVAGAASAVAVLLWLSPRAGTGLVTGPAPAVPAPTGRGAPGTLLWPPLAGAALWLLWGGWTGLAAGGAAAVLVRHLVPSAEAREARRQRETVRRDLPLLVLLLATALRSGAATDAALRQVCAALPGSAATRLTGVADRLALGVDAERVWSDLASDADLAPLGRSLARAHRTGASVAGSVERLADDLATRARAEVEDRARTVGVRAAVPLGLCLLPSFLLLGIVPLVATLLAGLRI